MGQQQLLLLVLGAIIVGIAIVVGLNMFSGSALKANTDAVRQDCLSIAARIEEWYQKPIVLGGGGKDFGNLNFLDLGYTKSLSSTGVYEPVTATDLTSGLINDNGTYQVINAAPGASTITIQGNLGEDNLKYVQYLIISSNNALTVQRGLDSL